MKKHIPIEASSGFFLYMAVLSLLLPLPWVVAVFLAGAIHEFGHLFALKCLNVPVRSMRLEAGGAKILAFPNSSLQELICAAAGPLAGILTVTLAPVFPRLALCATVQTAFNLLPLYHFDGGRILKSVVTLLLGKPRGVLVFRFIERSFAVLLSLIGISLLFVNPILSAFICAFLLRSVQKQKSTVMARIKYCLQSDSEKGTIHPKLSNEVAP